MFTAVSRFPKSFSSILSLMLALSKDYLLKKAAAEYEGASNEAERRKALQQNQANWTRRLNESPWLMKGQSTLPDGKAQSLINSYPEQNTLGRKYGQALVIDKPPPTPAELAAIEAAEAKANEESAVSKTIRRLFKIRERFSQPGGPEGATTANSVATSTVITAPPLEIKSKPIHFHLFGQEKQRAQRIYDKDERRKRRQFIRDNFDHIIVLQRVKNWLKRSQMPAHHVPSVYMRGYYPDVHQPSIPDEVQEHNLYPYPRRRHPNEPVIEILKPMSQVIEEDHEARKFRVGGRHSSYFGSHFLWPLKIFPDTISVLLPPNAPEHLIPEHNLLPDPVAIERQQHRANLEKQRKKRKIFTIRKAKLDLSRAPFRLKASPELPMKLQKEGRVVNKQFHYHHSHSFSVFPHENSVHLSPSPRVEVSSGLIHPQHFSSSAFNDNDKEEKKDGEESHKEEIHSSKIGSRQRFHLGLEDESVVQRQLQLFEQQSQSNRRPSTAPGHMPNNHNRSNFDDRNSLESFTFNSATDDNIPTDTRNLYPQSSQQLQQESSFVIGSEDALRSNLFSEHSNQFNIQPLLHVPLKRHRAILGLNKWQVKRGSGLKFKFLSRRTKEKIRREKELAEQEQEAVRKDLASKGIFVPPPVKHKVLIKKQNKTKVKVVALRRREDVFDDGSHVLDASSTLVSSIGEYS